MIVDVDRPRSAAIRVIVALARSPSPIRTRSSTGTYLADMRFAELEVATGAYSSTAPEARTTLGPSPLRVPDRRFTPTLRHASELLTQIEISRANSMR